MYQHLDEVKSMERDVWVAPFKDVAAYIAERDDIVLHVDIKDGKITVTPSLTLDPKLFDHPLTLCIDTMAIEKAVQGENSLSLAASDSKTFINFSPLDGPIIITLR